MGLFEIFKNKKDKEIPFKDDKTAASALLVFTKTEPNILPLTYEFVEEKTGQQIKYIYMFNRNAQNYDVEDCGHKIMKKEQFHYMRYDTIKEFFVAFPDHEKHVRSNCPEIEKVGMYNFPLEVGNNMIISKGAVYYQLPYSYSYPILLKGVLKKENGREVIQYSYT